MSFRFFAAAYHNPILKKYEKDEIKLRVMQGEIYVENVDDGWLSLRSNISKMNIMLPRNFPDLTLQNHLTIPRWTTGMYSATASMKRGDMDAWVLDAVKFKEIIKERENLTSSSEMNTFQDTIVSKYYFVDRDTYLKHTRKWTRFQSRGPRSVSEYIVKSQKLTKIGFELCEARYICAIFSWSIGDAFAFSHDEMYFLIPARK